MLTKLRIRNFKALKDTGDILLDESVVFVGANNSGKTTALQALALWQLGLVKWLDKRAKNSNAQKRTGVPINRKDIFSIPVRNARLMWSDLFVMEMARDEAGRTKGNKDVNIEIEAEGITNGELWKAALEFEYRDQEAVYVRPLRDFADNTLLTKPELLSSISVAFLPPMSGLKSNEEKLLPQTIEARVGEGRTAEVLRNICYQVLHPESPAQLGERKPLEDWQFLTKSIYQLFLVELQEPELDSRGEFELWYEDAKGSKLEIASAGRGLQQILLLLSYFLIKPKTTLLFDEPDSHLEMLKQKEVYNLLKSIATRTQSQIIAASHSEVVMREAAGDDDIVVAFYPHSKPHRINDQGKEILKALRNIGFEDYYLAQQQGLVLYLEGSTDLDILKAFAKKLKHPVAGCLEKVFTHYLNQNDPNLAKSHFTGVKDAYPKLKGIALYDRIPNPLNTLPDLQELSWEMREAENYFFKPHVLLRYAEGKAQNDLFTANRRDAMTLAIEDIIPPYALRDQAEEFWRIDKASEWLEKIFSRYYQKLGLPGRLSKNKFYHLIDFVEPEELDAEVAIKLDRINAVINSEL